MEGERIHFTPAIAAIVLLAHLLSAEGVCPETPRLKPLRCVCGEFTNSTGGPVSNVLVKVLKDGTEVASMNSGEDGKFAFGELKPGSYELTAQAASYRTFRSPIVVAKPTKKCTHRLAIFLDIGGLESCGSRVVKR